jgi:hypothetical protein
MSASTPSVVRAIDTPVAPPARRVPAPGLLSRLYRWLRAHMTDEWLVALLAVVLSIGFYAWYDAHGVTLAFNDARIRELIARRVLMSRTPGLGQLGTTWLPLPFLLMLPLIWNDALFSDGIAGSLPSMLAYVLAAVYMYRIARLVTSSRGAGWVAAAALALNPSLLYMQSTAMSETASVAAFVIAVYYALQLTRTYHALDIVKCAAAVAAGTLIRYENWVFGIALVPILLYVAWRRRGYLLAEAWAILYGMLAFAGCAAWIVYNAVIFHDPLLSFYYGDRSHTYFGNTPGILLPAHGHALVALTMYGLTVADTVGWGLVSAAILGLTVFVWRSRLGRATLPVYLTLVPFGFYWLALYRGVNTETLPGMSAGPLYNLRFGLATIPAVALFAAFLTMTGKVLARRALVGAALAVIVISSVIGSLHTPFVLREALYGAQGAGTAVGGRIEANWFSSYYRGGNVLITYVDSPSASMIFYLLTKHHLSDRTLITDANGSQFAGALAHPEDWVTWIVMDSDVSNGKSMIWTTLHGREDWRRYFILRKTFGTTEIYQRRMTAAAGFRTPAAVRDQAARWVVQQVSRATIVSCDPAMCAALQARGFPVGGLRVIRPGTADPLRSDLIVATSVLRSQFGSRLTSVYAPEVLASFGAGSAGIQIRPIAPDGAGAYLTRLYRDFAARKSVGTQLLRNPNIAVDSSARQQLADGLVDARLLTTIATMVAPHPLRIVTFGDASPGADAEMPLRSVTLLGGGGSPAANGLILRSVRAFLNAQHPPYVPASTQIVRLATGQSALRIQFSAPAPLGLIGAGHP